MRKMMVIVLAVLLTAGMASAVNSVWQRPAASGPGNWNDAANWDNMPDALTDYIYTGASGGQGEIQVTDTEYYGRKIYHGLNGPAPLIRVMNGGHLTYGTNAGNADHILLGYINDGDMLIEAGGLVTPLAKLYVGYTAGVSATLDVAGTLDFTSVTHGMLVVGAYDGSLGTCNILDGGVVKVFTFLDTYRGIDQPIKANGLINIEGTGKIVCDGDVLSQAEDFIDRESDHLAGNGVLGEVVAVYDPYIDETWVIASPTPAAHDLVPGDGADVPTANPLTLSWTIPSTYGGDGNDVYVKVWLGTDPNALTAEPNYPPDYLSPVTTVPASGLNITSVDIDGSVADTYYWRVDLDVHIQADPSFLVIGKVQSFNTVDDLPPVVTIETGDTMTWSNEPVAIAATVTDDAVSTLTYGWTADPDGSGDPNLTVAFSPDAGAEDPTVTITNLSGSMVPVTLTLTATDGTGSVDASVTLNVYDDACQMALVGLGTPHMPTDFNWDCITDLLDFNEIALRWLNETTLPTGPEIK